MKYTNDYKVLGQGLVILPLLEWAHRILSDLLDQNRFTFWRLNKHIFSNWNLSLKLMSQILTLYRKVKSIGWLECHDWFIIATFIVNFHFRRITRWWLPPFCSHLHSFVYCADCESNSTVALSLRSPAPPRTSCGESRLGILQEFPYVGIMPKVMLVSPASPLRHCLVYYCVLLWWLCLRFSHCSLITTPGGAY